MKRLLAALGLKLYAPQPPAPLFSEGAAFVPTHQHRKGGLYRVLAIGVDEATRTPAVIYDDADGTIWVRPQSEFDDGRFTRLDP